MLHSRMPKIYHLFFKTSFQRNLYHSWMFITMMTIGFISSTLSFNSQIQAQIPPVSSKEVTSFAQAVLAMEPGRQQAFQKIKKIVGGRVIPKIVCNDPSSINNLPGEARDIAVDYCNHSQKIVEDNGLSIDRFNQILIETQNNDNLKRLIYNTLLRLQKSY